MTRQLPVLLFSATLLAQTPVQLSLVVVDAAGAPIEGVEAYHTQKRITFPRTDANGVIALETSAPRIVLRKPGFKSHPLLPAKTKRGERITLYRPFVIQPCNPQRLHLGWPAQLHHTAGPGNASFQPYSKLVWEAQTYQETIVELNGKPAIDVRATAPDGLRWRYLGNLGETIAYHDADSKTALQLDDLITKACSTAFDAQVTDGHGHALADVGVVPAEITHDWRGAGTDGRYEGFTTSPRIVFRKFGYQSVVAKPALNMRIVMEPAGSPQLATCPSTEVGRLFHLLRFPNVRGRQPIRDVDYDGNRYPVKTTTGTHWLRHGSGPTWSLGFPSETFGNLTASAEYQEQTWLAGDVQFTAARGVRKDGTIWRFLGSLGESASYETKDPAAARKLDEILEGVCLATPGTP